MVHEPMSERVRDVGDGLILGFPISEAEVAGQEIDAVRLYFFRVASQTRYFQKYTSLSNIGAGNTTPASGYDWLGDTGVASGSDIFRIESDDWHVMHFGLGTEHPALRVYYAVSPNANGNPAQNRTGQGEDITPGTDDRGWHASPQIPDRYDPPSFTERVAFRNGSNTDGQFLQWAFWNDGNSQLSGSDLNLLFTGRGYKLQPVVDPGIQDTMLRMALSRPDAPVIDTILHQVGGVNEYTLGSEEPDDWKNVRKQDPGMARTFNVEEFATVQPPGREPQAATP